MTKHNYEPEFHEWMALEHDDGTFPPGHWACAGRWCNQYGVYLGFHNVTLGFIPEERVGKAVASMKRHGDADIARIVEGVRADVAALRKGKQELVRDLAGRRFRSC